MPNRILFVCTGNICRSPMAEAYMKKLLQADEQTDTVVKSAGTAAYNGYPANINSILVMKRMGIDLSSHQSSSLSNSLVDEADVIVGMTHRHVQSITHLFPRAGGKTCTLLSFVENDADVPDPYGGELEEYQSCFELMKPALDRLYQQIQR
jgi:protein-tyrosine-phosphatase